MDMSRLKSFIKAPSTNHIATPAFLFLGCWLAERLLSFSAYKLVSAQQAIPVIWGFSLFTGLIKIFAVLIILSFFLKKNFRAAGLSLLVLVILMPVLILMDLFFMPTKVAVIENMAQEAAQKISGSYYTYSPEPNRAAFSCDEYEDISVIAVEKLESTCDEEADCRFLRNQKCAGSGAFLDCRKPKVHGVFAAVRSVFYTNELTGQTPPGFESSQCEAKAP